ncbi:MAG: sialidase family protein [Bacillota bacterium]|nr:sialidase family protein [Bacillota bacterium]
MRGNICWNYRPFSRMTEMDIRQKPFICRVAPFATGFDIQWFDNGQPDGAHKLVWRVYLTQDEWSELPLSGETARVEGLVEHRDYEFKVVRCDGSAESGLRLVHTSFVPGTVVNYLHPEDGTYSFSGHSLCSPSIVRLPSGALMTAMDVFRGEFGNSKLTLLFRSTDDGRNWRYVTDIYPSFWPKLFVHRGALYLFSASQDYGDLLIGRSDDEGENWTVPTHIISGCGPNEMGPHKGPMPVIEWGGRLYTAIDYGCWRHGRHANSLLSIAADADLLDAGNWYFTPFTQFDAGWPGAPVGKCPGCIEGNAVVSPDGVISNYLRIDLANCEPGYGKAVVLRGNNNDPEAPLTLDCIVDCPLGSNSKFQMYRDPVTKKYIMIGTEQSAATPGRTVLSMAVSEDFYTWRVVRRLLDYRSADPGHVAFQYPDWIFDNEDILLLLRTAFGPSANYHDANYQTFMRITNFRQYLD